MQDHRPGAHPDVVPDDDPPVVGLVVGVLVDRDHRYADLVDAVVATPDGHLGTEHDVVADPDPRPSRHQDRPVPEVHIAPNLDRLAGVDAVRVEGEVVPAGGEPAGQGEAADSPTGPGTGAQETIQRHGRRAEEGAGPTGGDAHQTPALPAPACSGTP
ncbi:hypothetical protein GCM10011576_45530 [Micromonospora parathelypteridis]|nr:hypothetical protein GCM10011576_45530 [Micromonospora parathelypteridis]